MIKRRPQGKIGNDLPRVSGMTSTSTECRGESTTLQCKTGSERNDHHYPKGINFSVLVKFLKFIIFIRVLIFVVHTIIAIMANFIFGLIILILLRNHCVTIMKEECRVKRTGRFRY